MSGGRKPSEPSGLAPTGDLLFESRQKVGKNRLPLRGAFLLPDFVGSYHHKQEIRTIALCWAESKGPRLTTFTRVRRKRRFLDRSGVPGRTGFKTGSARCSASLHPRLHPFNPLERLVARWGRSVSAATATISVLYIRQCNRAASSRNRNKKAVSFASFSLRPFKENDAGCRAGTRRFQRPFAIVQSS